MTPTAIAGPALAFLDRLMGSDDVWSQGPAEGRKIAEHIVNSRADIVVLYGPASGATTDFIRRWVLPALEESTTVTYHARGDLEFGARADADIEIWDGFESCLGDLSSSRRDATEGLKRRLGARQKCV